MRKVKTLIGRPVISKGDGRQQGVVCDVVFETDSRQLLGVVLRGPSGEEAALRFSEIQAIGDDAVIVKEGALPRPLDESSDVTAAREQDDPLYGLTVISERGQAIGTIEDLLFDAETGKLTELEISDGLIQDFVDGRVTIPVPDNLSSRAEALVVSGEVEERVKATKGKNKRSD